VSSSCAVFCCSLFGFYFFFPLFSSFLFFLVFFCFCFVCCFQPEEGGKFSKCQFKPHQNGHDESRSDRPGCLSDLLRRKCIFASPCNHGFSSARLPAVVIQGRAWAGPRPPPRPRRRVCPDSIFSRAKKFFIRTLAAPFCANAIATDVGFTILTVPRPVAQRMV